MSKEGNYNYTQTSLVFANVALNGARGRIADLEAQLTAEEQKVNDAEWFRDEDLSAVNINFDDPPKEHYRWQIYNQDGDLIGDAMVENYWQALHTAREAGE